LERAEPLSLAWTPDGDWLVAACTDGHLRVMEPATMRIERTMPVLDGWAYSVAIGEDNVALVGGSAGQLKRVPLDLSKKRRQQ
jgi:WD40 repeat protein